MIDGELYLIDDREVVVTPHMHVHCDGGNALLGHPVEYLTLERGPVSCGYCDRRFVRVSDPEADQVRNRGTRQAD